jgi:hypothetical protein
MVLIKCFGIVLIEVEFSWDSIIEPNDELVVDTFAYFQILNNTI